MAVSPPPAPSSIDLSGLPPRVVEAAARVLALCREELRSEPRPEAPEEVELRVRPRTSSLAMSWAPSSRTGTMALPGSSRAELVPGRGDAEDDHDLARPVTYRRARYRSGASGASPVPVDESRRLPDAAGGRARSADDGSCTAREAAAPTGAMICRPDPEHARMLGEPRPTLGSIREAEGIPQDATTASVSLDGVMVPLRPGEDGRAKASWREAACGTVSFHDAEGKRRPSISAAAGERIEGAACEVAHIRRTPRREAMAPPTTGPSWSCRPKPR